MYHPGNKYMLADDLQTHTMPSNMILDSILCVCRWSVNMYVLPGWYIYPFLYDIIIPINIFIPMSRFVIDFGR